MPDIRVLNELTIKKDGVSTTYKLGTVNGYYNPTDGKFYEEVTHVTEIEGAPNLVYVDIAGNALYIYKTATSSFVKVSGEGGSSSDNLKFGYLNDEDGKFYEDDQYQVEIPGNADYLFIGLDNNTIYRYDTTDTAFVAIGGGESSGGTIEGYYNSEDGKFYQEETFTTEISGQAGMLYVDLSENKTYRYDESETKFIVVGGGGTEYQAGIGIDITNGVISGDYTAGHGISIDNGVVSDKTFVGTTAQWEALTSAQQAFYEERVLTDDEPDVQQKTNGHTIKDEDGVSKTQRSNLQFDGLDVTDDDVNDKTIIAPTTLKKEIYSVMGQNGAKNLIPYPYFDGTSKTNNGITYTVNDDGSITANGTATAGSRFYLISSASSNMPNGNYIISDGDVGNSTSNVQVALWDGSTYTGVVYTTNNGEKAFTLSDTPTRTGTSIYVSVVSGTTVSNLTFYPMLRLASDTDATYQPYAMTNKELTNALADKAEQSEVDDIADTLAKNVYSTLERFEFLTPGLIYTVPEEGYLNVISYGGTGYVIVQDANGNELGNVGYCSSATILLKKGMKVVLPSSSDYVPNDVRFRY